MADFNVHSVIPGSAKRRRAALVCFRCHEKKIKCDLSKRPGLRDCTNCSQAETECQLRPSKRGSGKKKRAQNQQTAEADTILGTIHIADGIDDGSAPLNSPTSAYAAPAHATPPLADYTDRAERPPPVLPRPNDGLRAVPPAIISPLPSQVSHTPSPNSTGSGHLQTSCFGDTGYMTLFSHDNVVSGDTVAPGQLPAHLVGAYTIPVILRDAFLETFMEQCFIWCPILDRDFLQGDSNGRIILDESLLLQQALALCGTRVNPPLIDSKDPAVHYQHVKQMFYSNSEKDPLVRLISIMLLFWWSLGAPNLPNMDNAYWWTGIAIRMAQEMGLHREPQAHESSSLGSVLGLRRRIWWTLFARDRILSVSQGRPPIIDLDYCSVKMITAEDFPEPFSPGAQIFIAWVSLQEISGRIMKQSFKDPQDRAETARLSQDLIGWVRSLPGSISISLHTHRTASFDKDQHRLFISYLTIVTLLHLSKSSQVLPRASKAAVASASCVARLLGDFLARGSVRCFTGDVGWEIAVAILALMHAYRVENLRPHVEADIRILRAALKEMAAFWPSSRMFKTVVDKLMASDQISASHLAHVPGATAVPEGRDMIDPMVEIDDWISYLPFISTETSPLISEIMAQDLVVSLPGLQWPLDIDASLQQILSWPEDADVFNQSTF